MGRTAAMTLRAFAPAGIDPPFDISARSHNDRGSPATERASHLPGSIAHTSFLCVIYGAAWIALAHFTRQIWRAAYGAILLPLDVPNVSHRGHALVFEGVPSVWLVPSPSNRPAPAAEVPGASFPPVLGVFNSRRPKVEQVSKHFTLIYPDGSKANISGPVKTDMLLAGEIREAGDGTFNYVGADTGVIVMHTMSELGKLKKARRGIDTNFLQHFYPGLFRDFVVGFVYQEESDTKRSSKELLQSPEAMALRLGIG
jgi:hypothetical protein